MTTESGKNICVLFICAVALFLLLVLFPYEKTKEYNIYAPVAEEATEEQVKEMRAVWKNGQAVELAGVKDLAIIDSNSELEYWSHLTSSRNGSGSWVSVDYLCRSDALVYHTSSTWALRVAYRINSVEITENALIVRLSPEWKDPFFVLTGVVLLTTISFIALLIRSRKKALQETEK